MVFIVKTNNKKILLKFLKEKNIKVMIYEDEILLDTNDRKFLTNLRLELRKFGCESKFSRI